MKIFVSYPPLEGKGTPMLGKNRQFQWFNKPTYVYPMVPASAATLAARAGHDVLWADGIAETVNFDHIKRHYYVTHDDINPTRIVPVGPDQDLTTPHGRARLG